MENAYVLMLKDSIFKDLYLSFCGYSQCEPYHSFGPAARPNYIIHFILDGKGVFYIDESRYKLQAGQGFIIEPEDMTFYQADKNQPWSYIWIGFGGTNAAECVRNIGLNRKQPTFQSSSGSQLKEIVMKMIRCSTATLSDSYRLQGLLYEFFSVLAEDSFVYPEKNESQESIYVRRAVQYIRNNYANNIRISEIADEICVSRSYLYKLFENNLGLSPHEFVIRFRLSRARELLVLTEMPISDIASNCGFYDSRAFSKVFKQQYELSPLQYRKQNRAMERNKLRELRGDPNDFSVKN